MKLWLIILWLTLSTGAYGISEVNYDNVYNETVLPFFKKNGVWSRFQSPDNLSISHVSFDHPNPRAHILILPGWTENAQKYAELVFDLYQFNLSIHILEWRGQGYSDRLLEDAHRTHIETYEDYVLDLDTYLRTVLRPRIKGKLVAIAHSMGANITSIYLTKGEPLIDKVVFSSPMLDIKTAPYPEWLAWLLARFAELSGYGDSYLPGHGRFDEKKVVNIGVRSETRYRKYIKFKTQNPDIISNGASFSWLRASLEATWYMKDNAHKIKTPLLMLQAGDDYYVDTEGQDMVCKNALHCFKIVFPHAFHEVYNDVDVVRDKVIKETMEFVFHDSP